MDKTLTVEQLVDAIREADNLADLKRLVGCGAQANEQHIQNMDKLFALCSRHGYIKENLPDHVRDEVLRLEHLIRQHEQDYC